MQTIGRQEFQATEIAEQKLSKEVHKAYAMRLGKEPLVEAAHGQDTGIQNTPKRSIQWSGLCDGEATAPGKLSILFYIQLSKEVGLVHPLHKVVDFMVYNWHS